MDAAVDGIPPIMWEPDRSMSTKMDELRVRINEKYNVDLRKFDLFRISSAFYRLLTALGRLTFTHVRFERRSCCSCTVEIATVYLCILIYTVTFFKFSYAFIYCSSNFYYFYYCLLTLYSVPRYLCCTLFVIHKYLRV